MPSMRGSREGWRVEGLPKIFTSDPIVRYYGWKEGEMIRIERTFCGSEPIEYFRVVSAA